MAVELTSPVLGQPVGATVTDAAIEPWLLAQGYAKRASYTGIGCANTGATAVTPANDPTLAANRGDLPWAPKDPVRSSMANDASNLNQLTFPFTRYDFDAAGVDADKPSSVILTPNTGLPAGGTVVTITGESLQGVTSVTFGGTAGTALDVTDAAGGVIQVTTPAKTAGAVNVVLVDASGNTTVTNGFTYAA